jgi:hypothetical protein
MARRKGTAGMSVLTVQGSLRGQFGPRVLPTLAWVVASLVVASTSRVKDIIDS